MGLYEDIKGAKDLWKSSSNLTKLFLLFSAFLALGSVATISDVIFNWKGFIKDGIGFYNLTIPQLFQFIIRIFNGDISEQWANYYVLAGLMVAGQFRVSNSQKGSRFYWPSLVIVILLLIIVLVGLAFRVKTNAEFKAYELIALLVAYFGPPIYFRYSSRMLTVYFFPAAFAVCGVLILAAINSGLTRAV